MCKGGMEMCSGNGNDTRSEVKKKKQKKTKL